MLFNMSPKRKENNLVDKHLFLVMIAYVFYNEEGKKMYKQMKKWLSNEKGFTLVEILVVISIIAILFVTLLPQIDFAGDKARQTGVKTDFHTLQIAGESYMREIAGLKANGQGLNSYLDKGMTIAKNGANLELAKLDPWGKKYDVSIYEAKKVIVVKSAGKDETLGNTDDFTLAVYYTNGIVASCTTGFETNNVLSETVSPANCGKFDVVGGALGTKSPDITPSTP